jgi:hypothetical protein
LSFRRTILVVGHTTPPVSDRNACSLLNRQKQPSPTCVKEHAQFDARIVGGEVKETDGTAAWNASYIKLACNHTLPDNCTSEAAWNASYNGVACNHTLPDNCTSEDILFDSKDSEAVKRWEELREIINTKMEDMHGKVFGDLGFGDLGEFAMTAVEKNRKEMNKLLGNLDKDSSLVGPMDWYDSPIVACSDVNACLVASEDSNGEEKHVLVMPPVPSA